MDWTKRLLAWKFSSISLWTGYFESYCESSALSFLYVSLDLQARENSSGVDGTVPWKSSRFLRSAADVRPVRKSGVVCCLRVCESKGEGRGGGGEEMSGCGQRDDCCSERSAMGSSLGAVEAHVDEESTLR